MDSFKRRDGLRDVLHSLFWSEVTGRTPAENKVNMSSYTFIPITMLDTEIQDWTGNKDWTGDKRSCWSRKSYGSTPLEPNMRLRGQFGKHSWH